MKRNEFVKTLGLLTAVGVSGISLASPSVSEKWVASDFPELKLVDAELVDKYLLPETKEWYYKKALVVRDKLTCKLNNQLQSALDHPNLIGAGISLEEIAKTQREQAIRGITYTLNCLSLAGYKPNGIISPVSCKFDVENFTMDEILTVVVELPKIEGTLGECPKFLSASKLYYENYKYLCCS